MVKFAFDLTQDEDLIVLKANLNSEIVSLIVDTGSSNTILDSNCIIIADVKTRFIEKKYFESAAGIVETETLSIEGLKLGDIDITLVNTYDFLEYGLASNYQGIIGIDFLKRHSAVINFKERIITLEE